MYKGPVITKASGLGASAKSEQNIAGMVFGGVVTATYTVLGTSVQLNSPEDADALGLNAAYDAANKVLVRYHINEYFRLNPDGTLWIMIVAQATTLAQMCTYANAYVTKLINDSGKKVKDVGVIRNPAAGYVSVLLNGYDTDVLSAVPLAQLLVAAFEAMNCYIDHIWIEGREINGTMALLKDLRTMNAPNVHVVGFQDSAVAALDALFAKHAAVGSALGMNGIRRIEEDLGSVNVENNPDQSVESYPINDGINFEAPALSSGTLIKTLPASDIQLLQDKGAIFVDQYPDYPGFFINKGSACVAIENDFAYGSRMRIWNAGARIVCKKAIPKINKKVATLNGKIMPSIKTEWEKDFNNSRDGLGTLVRDDHAISSAVFINGDTVLDANEAEIVLEMELGVYNYARKMSGKLKLKV